MQSGKGRGKVFKGKGKNNQQKGSRKSLQQRIMESSCRICGRRGHWKAECPDRPRATPSTTGSTAPAMTATTAEADSDLMSLEFMQLPVIPDNALDDEPSPQKAEAIASHVIFRGKSYLVRKGVNQDQVHKPGNNRNHATGVVPSMPLRRDFFRTVRVHRKP